MNKRQSDEVHRSKGNRLWGYRGRPRRNRGRPWGHWGQPNMWLLPHLSQSEGFFSSFLPKEMFSWRELGDFSVHWQGGTKSSRSRAWFNYGSIENGSGWATVGKLLQICCWPTFFLLFSPFLSRNFLSPFFLETVLLCSSAFKEVKRRCVEVPNLFLA